MSSTVFLLVSEATFRKGSACGNKSRFNAPQVDFLYGINTLFQR